jgi:hypothetical protein
MYEHAYIGDNVGKECTENTFIYTIFYQKVKKLNFLGIYVGKVGKEL